MDEELQAEVIENGLGHRFKDFDKLGIKTYKDMAHARLIDLTEECLFDYAEKRKFEILRTSCIRKVKEQEGQQSQQEGIEVTIVSKTEDRLQRQPFAPKVSGNAQRIITETSSSSLAHPSYEFDQFNPKLSIDKGGPIPEEEPAPKPHIQDSDSICTSGPTKRIGHEEDPTHEEEPAPKPHIQDSHSICTTGPTKRIGHEEDPTHEEEPAPKPHIQDSHSICTTGPTKRIGYEEDPTHEEEPAPKPHIQDSHSICTTGPTIGIGHEEDPTHEEEPAPKPHIQDSHSICTTGPTKRIGHEEDPTHEEEPAPKPHIQDSHSICTTGPTKRIGHEEDPTHEEEPAPKPHIQESYSTCTTGPKKGIGLIIWNNKFEGHGVEEEGRILRSLFINMGLEIKLMTNKTREAILSNAKEIANKDHSGYSLLVVGICTHCEDGDMLYASYGVYSLNNDLMPMFKPPNCPGLRGKPKIFLINSCHPVQEAKKVLSDDVVADGTTDESDFLVVHSTIMRGKGFTNFHCCFIAILEKNFEENRDKDLLDIIRLAHKQCKPVEAEGVGSKEYAQKCRQNSTLTKPVFIPK